MRSIISQSKFILILPEYLILIQFLSLNLNLSDFDPQPARDPDKAHKPALDSVMDTDSIPDSDLSFELNLVLSTVLLSDPDIFPEPVVCHYSILAPVTSLEIEIDPLCRSSFSPCSSICHWPESCGLHLSQCPLTWQLHLMIWGI